EVITCDSAEPRSIAALKTLGMRVIPAKKGPDSVEHGMKWLQTRIKIVIDPAKCPIAANEFSAYEYDRDKAGNILPRYPDKNNHTIDAMRYAMESVSSQRKAIVPK
ncbi:MAG TPA: terminase large subunit, partial [Candidatus Limiplasma sp.]|nr:terminase large subunit [Candidatus Limiplasma sp.]